MKSEQEILRDLLDVHYDADLPFKQDVEALLRSGINFPIRLAFSFKPNVRLVDRVVNQGLCQLLPAPLNVSLRFLHIRRLHYIFKPHDRVLATWRNQTQKAKVSREVVLQPSSQIEFGDKTLPHWLELKLLERKKESEEEILRQRIERSREWNKIGLLSLLALHSAPDSTSKEKGSIEAFFKRALGSVPLAEISRLEGPILDLGIKEVGLLESFSLALTHHLCPLEIMEGREGFKSLFKKSVATRSDEYYGRVLKILNQHKV